MKFILSNIQFICTGSLYTFRFNGSGSAHRFDITYQSTDLVWIRIKLVVELACGV